MDAKEFKTAEGSCIRSEEVIASIACTAAAEVPGVAGMANRPADIRGIISPNSRRSTNDTGETSGITTGLSISAVTTISATVCSAGRSMPETVPGDCCG